MLAHRINHLPTTQGEAAHIFHTTKEHLAGTGSVTTHVKLPVNMHNDGMPKDTYVISVTPSQPCAASVTNKTRHGFDVTLSALDGGGLAAGVIDVLVIG